MSHKTHHTEHDERAQYLVDAHDLVIDPSVHGAVRSHHHRGAIVILDPATAARLLRTGDVIPITEGA